MTELDFDELDRSIAAAMSSENAKQPDSSTTSTGDLVASNSSPDVSNASAPSAPAAPAVTTAPTPSLATKRRGQFMDIVHPSMSMNKPANNVSRTAAVVQPASEGGLQNSIEPAEPKVDLTTTNDISGATEASPESVVTSATSPASDATSDMNLPDLTELANSLNSDLDNVSETPQSPFLPEVKPEKRPLDALQSVEPEQTEEPAQSEQQSETSDQTPEPAVEPKTAQAPTFDSAMMEALQAELDGDDSPKSDSADAILRASDIQSAEAAALNMEKTEDNRPVVEPVQTTDPAPSAEVATESADANTETSPAIDTVPAENNQETAPTGPTSIPQQYKETQMAEVESGAIYDTSEYHTPVTEEVQKKKKKSHSGLKWLLVVALMLVLGAALGAGYYLLRLSGYNIF